MKSDFSVNFVYDHNEHGNDHVCAAEQTDSAAQYYNQPSKNIIHSSITPSDQIIINPNETTLENAFSIIYQIHKEMMKANKSAFKNKSAVMPGSLSIKNHMKLLEISTFIIRVKDVSFHPYCGYM